MEKGERRIYLKLFNIFSISSSLRLFFYYLIVMAVVVVAVLVEGGGEGRKKGQDFELYFYSLVLMLFS